MTIEIPVWVLWTAGIVIGVPVIAVILIFAWVGWKVASTWSPPRW